MPRQRHLQAVTYVKITGCTSPQRTHEVRELVGSRHLRVVAGQGDRDSYMVEYYNLSDAQLVVVNLNLLHGVHASVVASGEE